MRSRFPSAASHSSALLPPAASEVIPSFVEPAGGIVSLKKFLGKVLLFGFLQIGALSGVPMSPQQIEDLMEVMNRVQVVQVVKKERDND